MSRTLIAFAALAGLGLPVVAGMYALSSASSPTIEGLETSSLDADLLDRSLETEAPLQLSPQTDHETNLATVSGTDLTTLAAQDPEGARALVRQVLLNDPFILEEAITALETAREAQEDDRMAMVIADNAEALFSTENASIMGNPEGSVTLVEFLDYNCHFCKRAHLDVMVLIAENPDLRVIVKDFPVLGQGSLDAAQVAIAYRAIGGDMPAFIHAMMSEDSRPADAQLAREVAVGLGASEIALDLALDNPELMAPVAEAYGLAELLNISGTPAFVVGENRLLGAVGFDRMSAAIQAERERLSAL